MRLKSSNRRSRLIIRHYVVIVYVIVECVSNFPLSASCRIRRDVGSLRFRARRSSLLPYRRRTIKGALSGETGLSCSDIRLSEVVRRLVNVSHKLRRTRLIEEAEDHLVAVEVPRRGVGQRQSVAGVGPEGRGLVRVITALKEVTFIKVIVVICAIYDLCPIRLL